MMTEPAKAPERAPASAPEKPPAKAASNDGPAAKNRGDEDQPLFGDVFAQGDAPAGPPQKPDAAKNNGDHAINGEAVEGAEVDVIALFPPDGDSLPDDAVTVPVAQTDLKTAKAPRGDEASLLTQADKTTSNEAPKAAILTEAPKATPPEPQRPTVAQSVVEGRLPQVPATPAIAPDAAKDTKLVPQPKTETPPVPEVKVPVTAQVDVARATAATPSAQAMASATIALRHGTQSNTPLQPEAMAKSLLKAAPLSEVPPAPPPAATPAVAPVPAATAAVVPPAVALAQAMPNLQMLQDENTTKAVEADVLQGLISTERGAVSQTSVTAAAPSASVETARHISHQIASVAIHQNGKATEIALNPKELGRVSLTMTAVDGNIALNVVAERPETNDLLRRHIDVLAQEFRDLGYDQISFSFGEKGEDDSTEHSQSDGTPTIDGLEAIETQNITQVGPTSGLDLRL